MRLGLAFAIACACAAPPGAPATRGAAGPAESAQTPVTPAIPTTPPMITQSASRALREAPPAGAIDLVAVTPDGGAAITADLGGGIRLWPTLDGSREPRVVTLEPPTDLALARAGSGFIARVDRRRATTSR